MRSKSVSPIKLRVMAEYGSSGIWFVQRTGVFRHSMIEHSALNLPLHLSKKFDHWIKTYEQNLSEDDTFNTIQFNEEGRQLSRELYIFMKNRAEIEFVPENPDGSLSVPEHFLPEK